MTVREADSTSLYETAAPDFTYVRHFFYIPGYVAACGIPQPRKDHAVQMTRFARDILSKMYLLTRDLEVTLGPGEFDCIH